MVAIFEAKRGNTLIVTIITITILLVSIGLYYSFSKPSTTGLAVYEENETTNSTESAITGLTSYEGNLSEDSIKKDAVDETINYSIEEMDDILGTKINESELTPQKTAQLNQMTTEKAKEDSRRQVGTLNKTTPMNRSENVWEEKQLKYKINQTELALNPNKTFEIPTTEIKKVAEDITLKYKPNETLPPKTYHVLNETPTTNKSELTFEDITFKDRLNETFVNIINKSEIRTRVEDFKPGFEQLEPLITEQPVKNITFSKRTDEIVEKKKFLGLITISSTKKSLIVWESDFEGYDWIVADKGYSLNKSIQITGTNIYVYQNKVLKYYISLEDIEKDIGNLSIDYDSKNKKLIIKSIPSENGIPQTKANISLKKIGKSSILSRAEVGGIEEELLEKPRTKAIIIFSNQSNTDEILANISVTAWIKKEEHQPINFNILIAEIDALALEELKSKEGILAVYDDRPVKILLADPIPSINTEKENFGLTGANKKICVIDTGIDYTHPDLKNNYAGGIDIINDDLDPYDDNGHGTIVSGVITGIAPGAKIISVKALDKNGVGYESDLIKAIDYCISQNTDIISISVRGRQHNYYCDNDDPIINAANAAVEKGIIIVAATGNDGLRNASISPACIRKVISVAATDKQGNVWNNSNINGFFTDIFAPGVTSTTKIGGGYTSAAGTHMAAPYVAGAIALLLEKENMSPQDIEYRLRTTGKVLEFEGKKYSRIDVPNALANNVTINIKILGR